MSTEPPTPPQSSPGGWQPQQPQQPPQGPYQQPPPPPAQPAYGVASAAAGTLSGFWRRFLAYIIDAIVISVVASVIGAIITAIVRGSSADFGAYSRSGLVTLIIGLVYFGYLWPRNGQSLGYMALGIRLVRADGAPVTVGLALARYVLIYLSLLICLVPAIVSAFMIGLGSRKQAIHDMIVGTLVVRT
jgi:uncharacterized RDD family membrane protein YckC